MLVLRGRRFNDADVADVAQLAMAGLVHTPTAATKAISPAAATLGNLLE